MEVKGLFKAKKLSDEGDITGFFLRSGCFCFIVEEETLDEIAINGSNEVLVEIPLVRVLTGTVEPL